MTGKIYLTYGPPGCGKTTWAKDFINKNKGKRKVVIINRDDLRHQMFGGLENYKYSKENENYITEIQKSQINELTKIPADIIISDTNLNPKNLGQWISIAKLYNYEVEIVDFFERFKERNIKKYGEMLDYFHLKDFKKECKEFNLKREDRRFIVPPQAIDKMFNDYLIPKCPLIKHEQSPNLSYCVVCDIDGTLMHRLPIKELGGQVRSPYDESLVRYDSPDNTVVDSINFERDLGYDIFIFSGRHESCRDDTLYSLRQAGVYFDQLVMRPTDDNRRDEIIKYEMYLNHIHGKFNIRVWYDDRNRVVETMRDVGIKVYQVNPGDF